MPLFGSRLNSEAQGMEAAAKRYVALDGLRGVAAILVLLFHLRWAGNHTMLAGHLSLIPLVNGGFLAVDLFFIWRSGE